ncbi:MAG TPA: hypothetical protein VFZ44_12920 [Pyrinomonadaceae bacterium]
MKIFISWSGELSHKVALFLKEWFPNVIQTLDLYVSSEDIDKGARWFAEVGTELEDAQFGIVCLTRENMKAPWVLFEAGAISKTVTQSRVTPLLINLSPAEMKGPLVQFQATTITETDIKRLAKTINTYCEVPLRDTQLERVFDKWWPEFEQFIRGAASTVKQAKANERDERELLEEVLQHVRTIARTLPAPATVPKIAGVKAISIASLIKRKLESMGKPLLAVTIDGAHKVSMDRGILDIEFTEEARHLRDTLAKPENIRILREIASDALGRDVGVQIGIQEVDEIEEQTQAQRLREAAEQHPVVQQALKTFRSEIVDVRRKGSEEIGTSEGSFNE